MNKLTRIVFLKEFTEEIIFNLSKKHEYKQKLEIEKLKQKFLKPKQISESFNKIINHKILSPIKYKKNELKKQIIPEPIIKRRPLPKRLPMPNKKTAPPKAPVNPVLSGKENILNEDNIAKIQVLESIKPEYKLKPEDFNLGKIEVLLKDPLIQSIESPGPGKNILVKKYDKINVTKIILSQEEINEIIANFSSKAKIPLLGGILKAVVGNLVISAITSEFVGSRFIINRINPSFGIQISK